MSQILDAKQALIINGQPRFGYFDDALSTINSQDFAYETPFGSQRADWQKWLGFKEFQYFGGMSNQLIFGCAIAHLRYVAVAFVYVYDIEKRDLWSKSWRSPLGLGFSLASNSLNGETHFKIPALVDIKLNYQDHPRQKNLIIKCKELHIEARMDESQLQPMSICTQTGYNGWTYTAKSAGQPLYGFVELKKQRFDLEKIKAYGSLDFSTGYMRRETWWNWACSAGEIQHGQRKGQSVGLNLSTGVNETSFSENCFWLNGKRYNLNHAQFEFDRKDTLKPWKLTANNGQVQLNFQPMGMHREKVRAVYLNTHFRQMFGEFSGCIIVDGEEICLDGLKGFVEDQYITW